MVTLIERKEDRKRIEGKKGGVKKWTTGMMSSIKVTRKVGQEGKERKE